MGQKTNNRILWHGNVLNAEGKAVAPVKAVAGGDGTDGLNEGELYICNSDSDPALFILTDAGNVVRIDGNGSDTYTRAQINEKLNAKVDVAFFSRLFGLMDEEGGEIQVNDVETLASSIKAKLGFWTEQYLSALGRNPDAGSTSGGATTLAALTDVSITGTPKDKQVLAWSATLNKWTPIDMEATAGIDEDQLNQILNQKGYATQTWVTQQNYLTQAALDEALDGKLDASDFAAKFAAEMANWFVRDVEGKGIRPADYQGVAYGFYTNTYVSTKGMNGDAGSTTGGGVDADEVLQIVADAGYITSAALGNYALKSTRITAGTGLAGGGTLAGNVTLSLATVGTAGTYTKVTVDGYGRVTGHSSLAAADIPALSISKITGLQAELNSKLDAADFEELFEKVYVSGYGYAIRAKLAFYSEGWISTKGQNPDAGATAGGSSTLAGLTDVSLGSLSAGQILSWNGSKWTNAAKPASTWNEITGKPSWIGSTKPTYSFSEILNKPTTIAGYGITDAYTKTESDGRFFRRRLNFIDDKTTDSDDLWGNGIYLNATGNTGTNSTFPSTYGILLNFAYYDDNFRLQLHATGHDIRYNYKFDGNRVSNWKVLLNSTNYNNYTVTKTGGGASGTWGINISGKAATAGNADTLDGYHSSSFESYHRVTIDASGLNPNTWYPVTMNIGKSMMTRIRVEGTSYANASWNTRGDKTMALYLDYSVTGSGWGFSDVFRCVNAYKEGSGTSYCLRGIGQLTNSSTEYVYVRGGAQYNFYVSRFITPVLRTSTYTVTSQSIGPTTTTPAAILRNAALTTDNVASATKLQTARTLWGQSFDGTANVSGALTNVTSINASSIIYASEFRLNSSKARLFFDSNTNYTWVQGGSEGSYLHMSSMWGGNLGLFIVHATTTRCTGGFYADGYVSAKGQNTSSDLRLKTPLGDPVGLDVEQIARAPLFLFRWKDGTPGVEVGSSAQYWQGVLPAAVKERGGWLEMAYGNLALAAVITTARTVVDHEARIKELEEENMKLKEKLEMMERRVA